MGCTVVAYSVLLFPGLSKMASKKGKVDFLADAILSEISPEAREFAQNVQQFRKSLSLVKIQEMLRMVHKPDCKIQ